MKVRYLTMVVRYSAKESIGIKKYTNRSKEWMNKDILVVKKLVKKYKRKIEN